MNQFLKAIGNKIVSEHMKAIQGTPNPSEINTVRHKWGIEDIENEFKHRFMFNIESDKKYSLPRPDLVITSRSEEFKEMFGCEKLWIEFDVTSITGPGKRNQLMNLLGNDWKIIVFDKNGKYTAF